MLTRVDALRTWWCILICSAIALGLPLAGTTCLTDEATGAPLPPDAPGICVDRSGPVTRLVQISHDGLLVALADNFETDAQDADNPKSLRLQDRTGLLIFCPVGTLDPETSAPTPECMADFETLLTGRAAYLGFGTLQANVLLADEAERCGESLHVLGNVRTASGQLFEFRSSMASHRPQTGNCDYSQSSLSLSSVDARTPGSPVGSTEEAIRIAAGLDESQALLLERLMQLDASQLRMLDQLAATVPPADALAGGPFEECDAQESPSRRCIWDWVKFLPDKADTLLQRTNVSNFNREVDIRNTVREIGVERLQRLIQVATSQIQSIIDVAAALKQDFDVWSGSPACAAGSPCAAFKDDIERMVEDMKEVVSVVGLAPCLSGMQREERKWNPELLMTILDKAPPLLLFVMNRVMDSGGFDESNVGVKSVVSDWRTMFEDLLNSFGDDFQEQLASACGTSESAAQNGAIRELLQGDPIVCQVLRPEVIGDNLTTGRASGRVILFLVEIMKETYTQDNVVAQGTGVVAAGAGAGSSTPDPIKATLNLFKLFVEKIVGFADRIDAKRNSCLAMDATIEGDLSSCSPRLSYYLSSKPIPRWERPTFQQAVDHVQRRLDQVSTCQARWDGCLFLDTPQARLELSRARSNPDTEDGFKYLCDAMCLLRGAEPCNQITPDSPENCFNGADDDGDGKTDCDDPDCEIPCQPRRGRQQGVAGRDRP